MYYFGNPSNARVLEIIPGDTRAFGTFGRAAVCVCVCVKLYVKPSWSCVESMLILRFAFDRFWKKVKFLFATEMLNTDLQCSFNISPYFSIQLYKIAKSTYSDMPHIIYICVCVCFKNICIFTLAL